MVRRIFVTVSVLVFASVALGCDPCSDRTSQSCIDAITSACDDLAKLQCDKQLECRGEANRLAVSGGSPDACPEYAAQECKVELTIEGNVTSPDAVRSCASAFKADGCDVLRNFPTECTFLGDKEGGETCLLASQCKSGSCTLNDDTLCAQCDAEAPVSHQPEGSACNLPFDCAPLLVCDNGKCAKGQGEGQDCSKSPCSKEGSLHCNKMTNRCETVPIAGKGKPCVPPDGSLIVCDKELFCNESGVCAPLPQVGEACYMYMGCFMDENGMQVCGVTAQLCTGTAACNSAGMCKKLLLLGEACDAQEDFCISPTACVDGTCKTDDSSCQ